MYLAKNPFAKEGLNNNLALPMPVARPKEKALHYIDHSLLLKSMARYEHNHFVTWLSTFFPKEIVTKQIEQYKIGTSKRWNGTNAFFQIDIENNIRQVKAMLYNPGTGRRIKKDEAPIPEAQK